MQEGTTTSVTFPSVAAKDVLTELLREGAQRMLATAIANRSNPGRSCCWTAKRAG